MSRCGWRRVGVGLCTIALLGFTSAGEPLAGDSTTPARASEEASRRVPLPEPQPTPRPTPRPSQPPSQPPRAEKPPDSDAPKSLATPEEGSYAAASYTDDGIPKVAMRAYQQAASLLDRTDTTCRLHWSLLAGIGRVESNHGRHGDSQLRTSGKAVPAILGPVLDGSGATARISDTDGDKHDGNTSFDRAVGPMQFIPSTWKVAGVDGDGDGTANPGNIFDAAASAGRYLCAGDVDLSEQAQLRDAVYSYNHSGRYVDLVLRIASAYREGTPETATPPVDEDVSPPEPLEPGDRELPPANSGYPPPTQPDSGGNDSTPTKRSPQHGSPQRDEGSQQDPPDDPGNGNPGGNNPDGDNAPKPPDPPQDGNGGKNKDSGNNGNDTGNSSDDDDTDSGGNGRPNNDGNGGNDGGNNDKGDDGGDGGTDNHGDNGGKDGGNQPDEPEQPAAPAIEKISARQGTSGDEVTITGTGLQGATAKFGQHQAGAVSSSQTELTVAVPPRATAGQVQVTVHGKDGTKAGQTLKYTYQPGISDIDPAEGSTLGGDRVTITGTSLAGATADFGSATAGTRSSTGTKLVVETPERAAEGPVDVIVKGEGDTEAEKRPTYTYHAPEIGLEPAAGAAGEPHDVTVTAAYTRFSAKPQVMIGDGNGEGDPVTVRERSDTELHATLPEHGIGSVTVTVLRQEGENLSATFTYRPVLTKVEPASPAPGQTITIQGHSFRNDSVARLEGPDDEEVPLTSQRRDPQADTITVTLPEKGLPPGDYTLTVWTGDIPSSSTTVEIVRPDG